jgi:hypothetical protein
VKSFPANIAGCLEASGNATGTRARNSHPQTQQAVCGEIRNPAFPGAFDFFASQQSHSLEKLQSI